LGKPRRFGYAAADLAIRSTEPSVRKPRSA
jgi:hypothetical protein